MLGRMGPFAAINYIRHVMGYEEYLKEYAEFRRMNVEDLMEVLNELQESARAYKTYDEWFVLIIVHHILPTDEVTKDLHDDEEEGLE